MTNKIELNPSKNINHLTINDNSLISNKIKVSPIKIQGKKTKLIPNIKSLLPSDFNSYTYIEPFLGSAEVLVNLKPKKAIVNDINPYIINFFNDLKSGKINSKMIKEYLIKEGEQLQINGSEYWYKKRENFNENPDSLNFLFLNRSCFNGILRFNSKGKLNTTFCKKINRFFKALITKIINQVIYLEQCLNEYDWEFHCMDVFEFISNKCANLKNAFYYFDPPYIDRYSDYFAQWTKDKNDKLIDFIINSNVKFIYSNWLSNEWRENNEINLLKNNFKVKMIEHFYYVGEKLENRNNITKCLIFN